MSQVSRRQFLQASAAAAAGFSALPAIGAAVASGRVKLAPPNAPVAIGRCRTYQYAAVKASLANLFDLLGNVTSLVSGKHVVIKVIAHPLADVDLLNQFMTYDTHPEVVKAAAKLFLEGGASHVTVVENIYSQLGGAADFTAMGYDVGSFQSELGASFISFRNTRNLEGETTYVDLPVGSGAYLYDFFRLNRIYDVEHLAGGGLFVSIAKMKNHQIAGLTLAMKNLFGMAPSSQYGQKPPSESSTNSRTDGFHNAAAGYPGRNANPAGARAGDNIPRVIVDLNRARPIHLAILDGIVMAHGGEGPWNRSHLGIASPGVLLAGCNPLNVDSVAAAVMGYNPQAPDYQFPWPNACNHLRLAAERGLGTNDAGQIEVRGLSIAEARYDLPPTRDETS